MYSVIDIIKALSLLIEARFPAYPVNDRDLTEGFDRPSYFIDVDRVETTDLTAYLMQEESDIVLAFFEEDNYRGFLKLLQMKNQLVTVLKDPLKLTDENGDVAMHVTLDSLTTTVSKADKALICSFSTVLVQEITDPDHDSDKPLIDTLYTDWDRSYAGEQFLDAEKFVEESTEGLTLEEE